MKKNKNDEIAKQKEVVLKDNILLNTKLDSSVKKTSVFPEEFEEDRSMNIRMKPQPLSEVSKNNSTKN